MTMKHDYSELIGREAHKGPFKVSTCYACKHMGKDRWLAQTANNNEWIFGTECFVNKSEAEALAEQLNLAYAKHIMVQP
jgi:hypothetical protein